MAGNDPGMVIRVAADLTDLEAGLTEATAAIGGMASHLDAAAANVVTDQQGVTAAVHASTAAYQDLGAKGGAALDDLEDETKQVNAETGDLSGGITASAVAFGTFAGEIAAAGLSLAADALGSIAKWFWHILDDATGAKEGLKAFNEQLATSIRDSGVLQAGLDALKGALLEAFGGTQQQMIQTLTDWINALGMKVIDVGLILVEWGKTGAQVFGVLMGPLDALSVAINGIVTAFLDGLGMMYSAAAQIPGIGGMFEETAGKVKASADSWREYRDRAYDSMRAHDELFKGQGPVIENLNRMTTTLINVKASVTEASLVTRDTATAQGELNTEIVKFGEYQAAHTKWGPELLLTLGQVEKKMQDVGIATEEDMAKWSAWESAHTTWGPEVLTKLGTYTNKLIDTTGVTADAATAQEIWNSGLKFTAETVANEVTPALEGAQAATLSWSEAMDLVRQGQGTMTGTVGPATKPAGMSDMEFAQMQSDPRTWELLHGWDWQSPGGTGSTWKWLDAAYGGGGTTTTNINVNTVMGDKHEIARVVKDALADDWRSSGVRG